MLQVSDAFWITVPAMIAAITASIATLFGVLNSKKSDALIVKSDAQSVALKEVHEQGNSRALAADEKLSKAIADVAKLQALVTEMSTKAQTAITAETIASTMRESIRETIAETSKSEKPSPKG